MSDCLSLIFPLFLFQRLTYNTFGRRENGRIENLWKINFVCCSNRGKKSKEVLSICLVEWRSVKKKYEQIDMLIDVMLILSLIK
jgi:hypothetical protein